MKFASLCVFLTSGHTFTFRDVSILCDNETTLQFNYRAMSDGKAKRFTGRKDALAGYSVSTN